MRAPDSAVPGRAIPLASAELLTSAVNEVEAALVEPSATLRYSRAQLAARRAAAAVLAAWAQPVGVRGHRPRDVWQLLPEVAPVLNEWAQFFTATAGVRIAAEAGVPNAVSTRQADDMVRDAHLFLERVVVTLSRGPRSTALV